MKFYWIKTHRFIKKIFSNNIWDVPNKDNKIYLTFDDGPTPEITEWVLQELEKHKAKATFFCIGKNIENHPAIFAKLLSDGHCIGNHTFNHLNGWKTSTKEYVKNSVQCSVISDQSKNDRLQSAVRSLQSETSNLNGTTANEASKTKNCSPQSAVCSLFRPPYGKIRPSQSKKLRQLGYKIIMWDVLSADFDTSISKEKCLENVLQNVQSGSVIVFHDSVKAFANLEYALPKSLQLLKEKGFVFETLD